MDFGYFTLSDNRYPDNPRTAEQFLKDIFAEALWAESADEPRQMLAACRRGLEVLEDHRLTLGASELRAQATARGAELASLAQWHAVRIRRPRLLLSWT